MPSNDVAANSTPAKAAPLAPVEAPNGHAPKASPAEVDLSFRLVAIDKLQESETNPRRAFDPQKLTELAENIKHHGVLVPLLVRPFVGWRTPAAALKSFEIVAGARRYRAAKLAGIAKLPVRVVDLGDAAALEVQVIENLQREDVHPLEEGEGFRRLLDIEGYTPELLAEKVGRDLSYIYKRLQFASLIDPLKVKFLEGEILIAHSILLCRLSEADQVRVLREMLYEDVWNGSRREPVILSAKRLDGLIRENIYLDLKTVPWDRTDAALVAQAGACNTCPKRSAANAHLFDDVKKGDVCLDSACFQGKREAHLVKIEKASAAEGVKLVRVATEYLDSGLEKKLRAVGSSGYKRIEGKKKCPHAEKALVVTGRSAVGKTIEICRNGKCKVHHPYGYSSQRSVISFGELWAEKKRKLEQKIERAVRLRLLGEVLGSSRIKWAVPHAQMQAVARKLLPYSTPVELLNALDLPMAKGRKFANGSAISKFIEAMIVAPKGSPAYDQLPRVVLALSLEDAAKEYTPKSAADSLKALAEAFEIDQKKIETAVRKQLSADFERQKARALENRKKTAKKERA